MTDLTAVASFVVAEDSFVQTEEYLNIVSVVVDLLDEFLNLEI